MPTLFKQAAWCALNLQRVPVFSAPSKIPSSGALVSCAYRKQVTRAVTACCWKDETRPVRLHQERTRERVPRFLEALPHVTFSIAALPPFTEDITALRV